MSVAFLTIFFVTQWYFSAFLLSNAGHNALFMGGRSFSYNERPGPWMREYWDSSGDFTLISIAIAFGLAYISTRIGLAGGKGLQRVVR